MNMMEGNPQGTVILRTYDTAGHVKNSEYLADLMDESVQEIGPENVVQVATDNAPVCVAALRFLEHKYPHIVVTIDRQF